jgi:hypothetical protein
MPLRTRTTHLSFLLLTTYSLALAQTFDPTKPTKDYIRLNGQVVAIENGVASLPIVLFSDSIITFAKRSIGTASASQALKITNGGTAPLAIASVALSGTNPGDFILSNGCGSTLAAGANCSVGIVFEPTAAGSRQAALVLTDDAAGSPQTVTLTGTGVNGTGTASASYVGTDTATQGTWTGVYGADGQLIANDLNNAPPYATVSLSGDSLYTWAASTTDVRALQTASGAPTRMASTYYSSTSFTINLNLTDGNTHKISLYLVDWDRTVRTETIAILDANSSALLDTESYSSYHTGEYAAWTMQGHVLIQVTKTAGSNGVVSGVFFDTPPPAAALTPAGLTFGNQGVGTASASQSVTLTNGSATTALTIGSVAITGTNAGDFSVADGCAASLDAGASCQLDVTFTPTAGGTRTAALTITDNAGHGASSAQGVSLTGMGVAPEPDAVVPATPLIFPLAAVGTSDPVQTVTLSNLGNAALAISSIAVTGANPGDFSASNNCGATLAIETSCTVTVGYLHAGGSGRQGSDLDHHGQYGWRGGIPAIRVVERDGVRCGGGRRASNLAVCQPECGRERKPGADGDEYRNGYVDHQRVVAEWRECRRFCVERVCGRKLEP